MRLEKWFISNLDDSQRKIIIQSITDDIIVQGAAGSGKTNLAIHRALQAKNKGSYAIVIFTVALKRMIAYGMQALGLDKERIAYEWAWTHRGFDLTGDVYWEKGNRNTLYLVNDLSVRKFERTEKDKTTYGIDFADWVDYKFYSAFGRRVSWFREIPYTSGFSVTNTEKFELIPSGTMYKQSEDRIDYLIIDEAQDFNVSDYQSRMIAHRGKSLSLFGDSVQQMNFNGSSIDEIAKTLGYKRFSLDYNYRLPKTIAKVAQQIQSVKVDLMTNNMKDGGNSDYPNYPKPIITKYSSKEKELEGILNRIKMEDLDDVAILVPDESDVREVNDFLTQVFTCKKLLMTKKKLPVRFTGQHFTIDKVLIKDAIRQANISNQDTVLDIGAGKGFLTVHLLKIANNVVAIENDTALVEHLRKLFSDARNVQVVGCDFRNFAVPKFPFKVVSNIPYGITSDIFKILMFESLGNFLGGSIVLQLEPTQKLFSRKLYNPYTVFYHTFFDLKLVYEVGPESFLPPPTVKSALLNIKRKHLFFDFKFKAKYLAFISCLLEKPDLSVKTALKSIFRKSQVRSISEKFGLNLNAQIVCLSPSQWLNCFLEMLEVVPEKFHPS